MSNIGNWIIGISIVLAIGVFADDTNYVMVGNAYVVGADDNELILCNNQTAINPTYEELILFVDNDKTEHIIYNCNTFVCGDFAELLHNNAEAYGYSAAFVYIKGSKSSHAMNAFNTVDKGLIFVDCTGVSENDIYEATDCFAVVEHGKYIEYSSVHPNMYIYPPLYELGIVENFEIIW